MAPLRGELSPKVTEGWLVVDFCPPGHPSPPNGGAPLEGEPRLSKKCIVGANSVRPAKPPLCKGRWHGVSRDGGIGACMGVLGYIRKVTIPQSASLTAPFTQGSLKLYPHRVYFGPGGVPRPPLWGSQGRAAPKPGCCAVAQRSKPQWGFEAHERASFAGWRRSLCAAKRALSEVAGTFFASFLGVQKGRTNGRIPL